MPSFSRRIHLLNRKTTLVFFSFGVIALIVALSASAPAVQPSTAYSFQTEMHSIRDWEDALPSGLGWGGVNDIRFPSDGITMTANPVPHPNIPAEVLDFTIDTQSPPNQDHQAEMILGHIAQPESGEVYFGGWVMYPEAFSVAEDGWFVSSQLFGTDRAIVGSEGPILVMGLNDAPGGLEPRIVWYPDVSIKRVFYPPEGTVIPRGEWTHVEFKYTLDPANGGVRVRINGQEIAFRDDAGAAPTSGLPTVLEGDRFHVMFNLYSNDLNMAPAHMYLGPAHLTVGGWHGPTS